MKKLLYCTAIALLTVACKGEVQQDRQEEETREEAVVELTAQQMSTIGIAVGPVEQRQLAGSIKATGTLKLSPQDRAEVTSLVPGVTRRILVKEGQTVSQGQTLALVENTEIVALQKDYLVASRQLALAQQAWQRQQEIRRQGAGVEKNLQQAQAELPGWQLKIVGSGKAAPQLKALADTLCLKRCSFEGYSTRVGDYYGEASILCLTSSFEGWPMCIAEAQAHGVVPIVFNSFAGAADQIAGPDEGILVEPYDEAAFARELTALATDGTRLADMRQAVVKKAATYTMEHSGRAWERMFHHLISTGV